MTITLEHAHSLHILWVIIIMNFGFFSTLFCLSQKHHCQLIKGVFFFFFFLIAHLVWGFSKMASRLDSMK